MDYLTQLEYSQLLARRLDSFLSFTRKYEGVDAVERLGKQPEIQQAAIVVKGRIKYQIIKSYVTFLVLLDKF